MDVDPNKLLSFLQKILPKTRAIVKSTFIAIFKLQIKRVALTL